MESVRALTEGLIDYAGLFPPAGLEMRDAVRNYAEYLAGPDAAMLGRFVLPASRLPEFAASAAPYLAKGAGAPWQLAVLLGEDFESDLNAILQLDLVHAVIDTAEIKVSNAARVARIKKTLPDSYRGFLEVPSGDLDENFLDAIRNAGFSAKIRTGGVEAGAFPPASTVIRFLSSCKEKGIAFKATAGLHHIVCGSYPMTYEPNAAKGEMFGFLNVFLAAAFLFNGTSADQAEAVLHERDAAAFQFKDSSLTWRARKMSADQIRKARREFAVSFGSCSFTEPVEELKRMIGSNTTRTS